MRSYRDRVIVGSPGAGQYRVFSSVREHSQHSATMAENGRQLPNAAPATLSSSLSLSLSLSVHAATNRRIDELARFTFVESPDSRSSD